MFVPTHAPSSSVAFEFPALSFFWPWLFSWEMTRSSEWWHLCHRLLGSRLQISTRSSTLSGRRFPMVCLKHTVLVFDFFVCHTRMGFNISAMCLFVVHQVHELVRFVTPWRRSHAMCSSGLLSYVVILTLLGQFSWFVFLLSLPAQLALFPEFAFRLRNWPSGSYAESRRSKSGSWGCLVELLMSISSSCVRLSWLPSLAWIRWRRWGQS